MSRARKPQTFKEGLLANLPTSASEGDLVFTSPVSNHICLCPAERQIAMLQGYLLCSANILEETVRDRICPPPCSEDTHAC